MSRPARARTARRAGVVERRPAPAPAFRLEPRSAAVLGAILVVGLALRAYGAFTFGFDMDGPGTFSMVNYDEGNSCRGALGELNYPTLVGRQTVALARLLGYPPPPPLPRFTEAEKRLPEALRIKGYCESKPLTIIQRAYTVVTGALSAVLLGLLALMMWPDRPQIGWTAAALFAVSNFTVAESHLATVDVPQVFVLLLLTTALAWALVSQRRWPLVVSPLLLVMTVSVKWYVFAAFAYAPFLPRFSRASLTPRQWAVAAGATVLVLGLLALVYREWIAATIFCRGYLVWGSDTGRFGTDYGHIGTWRRWIRNAVDLPVVHLVALGIPACLFVWGGARKALADREKRPLWLLQMPALVYTLYMLGIGPVTYYRHYLPIVPTVTLLAAYGFWESRWSRRRALVALFLLYPLLVTLDSEWNYRHDPRRALRQWWAAHPRARVLATFYVVPPPGAVGLFDVQRYLSDPTYLRSADYVILSENWYDTSFANELNGPIAWDTAWLVKTRPEWATAYRRILAGQDPRLVPDAALDLRYLTPELALHRVLYGSFPLWLGDLKIFRVAM